MTQIINERMLISYLNQQLNSQKISHKIKITTNKLIEESTVIEHFIDVSVNYKGETKEISVSYDGENYNNTIDTINQTLFDGEEIIKPITNASDLAVEWKVIMTGPNNKRFFKKANSYDEAMKIFDENRSSDYAKFYICEELKPMTSKLDERLAQKSEENNANNGATVESFSELTAKLKRINQLI